MDGHMQYDPKTEHERPTMVRIVPVSSVYKHALS